MVAFVIAALSDMFYWQFGNLAGTFGAHKKNTRDNWGKMKKQFGAQLEIAQLEIAHLFRFTCSKDLQRIDCKTD